MRTGVLLLALGIGAVGAWGQVLHPLELGAIQPVALLAADLNRDGFPDLAVACHSSNAVVVFENTRAPGASFKDKVQWTLEDAPVALAAGLFMDPPCTAAPACLPYTAVLPSLVVATQYQPGLVRFTPVETKAPFLKLVPGGPLKVEVLPFTTFTHLALADFDQDGTTDVAVLDGISMKVGFYLGARAKLAPAVPAQGSLARPPDLSLALDGRDPYFLGVGDFDRDGLVDLVVSVDGFLVFLGNETREGKLQLTKKAEVKLGTKLKAFALADFNRDGYVDVAVVDPEFGALTVVLNRGCWRFERGARLKLDGGPVAVVAADFDRNGLLDLAVAEKDANRVVLILQELVDLGKVERPDPATHTVSAPERVDLTAFRMAHAFEVGRAPVALAAEDFDRDGMVDLAVALHGENKVGVIYNPALCRDCAGRIPGQARAAEEKTPEAQTPSPEEGPTASSGSSALEASGASSAWAVEEVSRVNLRQPGARLLAAGDLNGDGKADLVLAGVDRKLLLYQGLGTGEFLAKGDLYVGFDPDRLLVADFDGDGHADVLALSFATREMALLLFAKDFTVALGTFRSLPAGVKDVLALQLDASKGRELVWLKEGGAMVWSVGPKGTFLEWSRVPAALAQISPRPSPLYAYAGSSPADLLLVHYSNNPGELSFLRDGRPLALFQVAQEAPLLALSTGDLDGDGVFDLLGLEEGGGVRLWRVRKEAP